MNSAAWRVCFAIAGLTIAAGGFTHPRGASMADMLADPNWVMSHVLQLAGYTALTVGVLLARRSLDLPTAVSKALLFAAVASALQAIEMAFHTASVVDLQHLVHGESTPVLTTHLALSMVFYPIFGAAMVYLITRGARSRSFGHWSTAWLGIIGAAAHGAAPPLVVGLEQGWARILFPMVILFALWLVLTAAFQRSATTREHVVVPTAYR